MAKRKPKATKRKATRARITRPAKPKVTREMKRAKPKAAKAKSGKVFVGGPASPLRLIAAGDLKLLMTQTLKFQKDASRAAGSMGDLVRDYAANKNLHRGAFHMAKRLFVMGKTDPGKLWLHLAHFDHMRQALGVDKMAEAQTQLLPADTERSAITKPKGRVVRSKIAPGDVRAIMTSDPGKPPLHLAHRAKPKSKGNGVKRAQGPEKPQPPVQPPTQPQPPAPQPEPPPPRAVDEAAGDKLH